MNWRSDICVYTSTCLISISRSFLMENLSLIQERSSLLSIFQKFLTLSLLGYLKTRIRLGGGSIWPPPSKSHVWCPNITNDTTLESSCALLLESEEKIENLQKLNFFGKSSYKVKICENKNCPKNYEKKHLWKALDHAISNMQKILQHFKYIDF